MKVFKLVSSEKDGNKCKFLNINYIIYIDNQHQFAIIIIILVRLIQVYL